MKRTILSLALIAVTGLLFPGCGDDPASPDGTGTLRVLLTDAPAAFDHVNVTISGIAVHAADADTSAADSTSGWITVSEAPRTLDLLALSNGLTSLLGENALDEGHYTQIRFTVESAEVVIDSVSYDLTIPSGTVKLVSGFDITEGVSTEIALDFDAARSVHKTGAGHYMLRPAVRMIQTALTGSIGGTVTNSADLPVAYAISGADTVTSTTVNPATGAFTLAFLPAGSYTVAVSDTLGQSYTAGSAVTVTLGVKSSAGSITLQ